jgi:hypothetical protein
MDFLESVLKLSTFFAIEDARLFAIRNIAHLPKGVLHPARRLHLAHRYNVDEWAAPAFEELLLIPTHEVSAEDVELLGLYSFRLLVSTQAVLMKLRSDAAWHVPEYIESVLCTTTGYCQAAWSREWKDGIGRLIMHPEEHIPLSDIQTKLTDPHLKIPGMCSDCMQFIVASLISKGILEKEATTIQKAVKELMDFQTDKAVRIKLSEMCSVLLGKDANGQPIPLDPRPLQ